MLARWVLAAFHFNIPLGGGNVIGLVIAEFDDGNGFEHGPRYSSYTTLPWASYNATRTISLWMAVGSDRTGDDNP